MKNILKRKNKAVTSNIDTNESEIEFEMEDDVINLGIWIQINSPELFEGSYMARCRYLIWLLNAIIILASTSFILTMYVRHSIRDIIQV